MDFNGPVAGNPLLATQYSPVGLKTRGTHNNCGNGYTPWGTYLTTEENFIGYFKRSGADEYAGRSDKEKIALKRYGLGLSIDYLYEKNADGTPKKDEKGQIIYILDGSGKKIPNKDAQNRTAYLDTNSRYAWETAVGAVESQDLYDRWSADVKATTAAEDYRAE